MRVYTGLIMATDTSTINNALSQKEANAPFNSSVPQKPQLTMDQKLFGGFGWDTSEFLDNDRVQQNKAPQSAGTGSLSFNSLASEATQGLSKTAIKGLEGVGAGAQEVTSASIDLARMIIGAPESTITYTKAEQPKTPEQAQEAQKKAEEKGAFEFKIESMKTIEVSMQNVRLEDLRDEMLRIIQDGMSKTKEQRSRRLNLQANFEDTDHVYYWVEERAADIEDADAVKQQETSQSIAETSDPTKIHVGNFEGGNVKGSAANVSQTGGGGAG